MGKTLKFLAIMTFATVAMVLVMFMLGQYIKTYSTIQYKLGVEKGSSEGSNELYNKGQTDVMQRMVDEIKNTGYTSILIRNNGTEMRLLVLIPYLPK